jgi:hypothetical protein
MRFWQKAVIFATAVFLVLVLLLWWTSYEPLTIVITNERPFVDNATINVTVVLTADSGRQIFNRSVTFNRTGQVHFDNVTTRLGSYCVEITVDNASVRRQVKYGKYFEVIDVVIRENGIDVYNERTCRSCPD